MQTMHRCARWRRSALSGPVRTAPCAAQSDPVADFYRGKTVNVFIGVGVGGEYDLQARLVAKYIGRHIPGRPNVVPQNMTGASGLKMLNFLYNQAPRDGTAIGMIQNGFPAAQAIGRARHPVRRQPTCAGSARSRRWSRRMAVWHTAGVPSIDDARKKEIIVGATARGGITYTYPALMNELLGTKFKIVTGYTGGNEINIAMERGEVQGRNNSWSSWKVTKTALAQGEENTTSSRRRARRRMTSTAPMIEDLVKNAADRQLVDLIMSGAALGRPMATTPDVPEPRLRALRAAFLAAMKDPDFVAETAKLNIEIDPVGGEAMQKIVADVLATPKPVAARAKPLLE